MRTILPGVQSPMLDGGSLRLGWTVGGSRGRAVRRRAGRGRATPRRAGRGRATHRRAGRGRATHRSITDRGSATSRSTTDRGRDRKGWN